MLLLLTDGAHVIVLYVLSHQFSNERSFPDSSISQQQHFVFHVKQFNRHGQIRFVYFQNEKIRLTFCRFLPKLRVFIPELRQEVGSGVLVADSLRSASAIVLLFYIRTIPLRFGSCAACLAGFLQVYPEHICVYTQR